MSVYLTDLRRNGVREVWRMTIKIAYNDAVVILAAYEKFGDGTFNCSITSECEPHYGRGIIFQKNVEDAEIADQTLRAMRYTIETITSMEGDK